MTTMARQSSPSPLISIKDIWFKYDQGFVLRNASLDIYKGDYLGVIGPNGSSKSTLIKLALGMMPANQGQIILFNQNIKQFTDWHKLGYVSQKSNAFNSSFPATVYEVVAANLYARIGLFKRIGKKHKDAVERALNVVGMWEFNDRLIGQLSGGQQQKVFIARALVSDPEVLFLDEPTVGIDANSQIEFYNLLERLNRDLGMTIVMVSHDIGAITDKVNRIACLNEGEVVSHDTCCAVPALTFLEEMYGDHYKLMVHHHNHDHGGDLGVAQKPLVQLEEGEWQ